MTDTQLLKVESPDTHTHTKKKSALWQCGTKETNPAVLEVVVQDTMKMKDKDGDGVLSAKEFWEFGEEDGSSHQL